MNNHSRLPGLFPLSEAIAWSAISPYIYSMVQSFPSSKSEDPNSAIYAGIMVSVFTFGEFIMAPQWAKISDRIGRKPTLLLGSIGAMFLAVLFGLSTSLPWAIIARLFAGLLNPNLGVVQTFVGELVRREEQGTYLGLIDCIITTCLMSSVIAKGFSVVPFLRGFG
jgi:MFS family permease